MQNESGQVKRKRWFLRWWMFPIYFIIVIIILASIGGSSSSSTTTAAPTQAVAETPKVVISVSAVKLYEDYKANEVAADAKYKGNTLKVSGTVGTIGKDILDNPYITLTADQYGFNTVQCMFSKQDEPLLAQVSKGSSIVLQGTGEGLTLLSPMIGGCQIVK